MGRSHRVVLLLVGLQRRARMPPRLPRPEQSHGPRQPAEAAGSRRALSSSGAAGEAACSGVF